MKAYIKSIDYYLPSVVVTNEDLSREFPDWSVENITNKTGIMKRHIALKNELSSDMAIRAAERLFESGVCTPNCIDYVLFCTQSPDYFLPTSACLIQDRLKIKKSTGALDFNLGCSGFVYGLGIAKGLIETGQAENILLLTAETYSKYINQNDKSNRTIFGDAGAAVLIGAGEQESIGPFVYGTDGGGYDKLMVKSGGGRYPQKEGGDADYLKMDGGDVFAFSLTRVPQAFQQILKKATLEKDDIDLFVFHQANKFMLSHLQRKLKLSPDKFFIYMEEVGNTVSSTIPIALCEAQRQGKLTKGMKVMLLGFGVGYSWGATILTWK